MGINPWLESAWPRIPPWGDSSRETRADRKRKLEPHGMAKVPPPAMQAATAALPHTKIEPSPFPGRWVGRKALLTSSRKAKSSAFGTQMEILSSEPGYPIVTYLGCSKSLRQLSSNRGSYNPSRDQQHHPMPFKNSFTSCKKRSFLVAQTVKNLPAM